MKNKKINITARNNISKGSMLKFKTIILAAGLIQLAFPLSGMASGLDSVSQFLIQSHITDESTVNHNLNFYLARILTMKSVISDSGLPELAKKQKLNRALIDLRYRVDRQLKGLPNSVVTFLDETVLSSLSEAQQCVQTDNTIRLSQILDTAAQTLHSLKTK